MSSRGWTSIWAGLTSVMVSGAQGSRKNAHTLVRTMESPLTAVDAFMKVGGVG